MITIEPRDQPNFYMITGGPGVGKTTLLHALARQGFSCMAEVARTIIQEQMKVDGDALPWKDKVLYAQLMLERSVDSYEKASQYPNETVFFDRGLLDTLCYATLINMEITEEMDRYARCYRYHSKVFILPPWFEIYKTDNERKQNWEEAVQTYENMIDTYRQYDYELIEVPKTTLSQRLNFVLQHIQSNHLS